MNLKPLIAIAALLISGSALAQQGSQDTPNFILGHGFLQPATPQTWDYPPGHQMKDSNVSLPVTGTKEDESAKSRNGTEGREQK